MEMLLFHDNGSEREAWRQVKLICRFGGSKLSQVSVPIFGFYFIREIESNATCLICENQTFEESEESMKNLVQTTRERTG